jgi:hypothetical protein
MGEEDAQNPLSYRHGGPYLRAHDEFREPALLRVPLRFIGAWTDRQRPSIWQALEGIARENSRQPLRIQRRLRAGHRIGSEVDGLYA